MEYCRIEAFKRLYFTFSHKKFNIINTIWALILLVLGIPFKILKLFYFFIFKQKTFLHGLKFLYFNSYSLIKECKIEILHGRIYLNCFTICKLLNKLGAHHIPNEKIHELLTDLQSAAKKFYAYESENRLVSELRLGQQTTHEGIKIPKFHYIHYENNNTIHSTSKIPIDLLPSQISSVAIEELVKPNAKNPGTVISTNIQHISYFDKSIFVSTYPLETIKICHTNFFNINNNIINYNYDKKCTYYNIIHKHVYPLNSFENVLNELCTNCYNIVLLHSSHENFLFDIYNFKSDF